MFDIFKEDIKRYFNRNKLQKGVSNWDMIIMVAKREVLWLTFLYRYTRWINMNYKKGIVRYLLKIPYVLINTPLAILFGVHLSAEADIGKGLYIGHYGGIWLGASKTGDYCNISQEMTVGIGGRGELRGLPEIGNRVYIGPGAKVFGKITIGNNVAIGANAVVSKSIPDNAVVVGNPGRIISYAGSYDLINVQELGMEAEVEQ